MYLQLYKRNHKHDDFSFKSILLILTKLLCSSAPATPSTSTGMKPDPCSPSVPLLVFLWASVTIYANPLKKVSQLFSLPLPLLPHFWFPNLLSKPSEFTEKKTSIDNERLRSFTVYGAIVSGPMLYLTYNKILPFIAPGTSHLAICKKLLFTQTIFTLVSMSAFYTAIPILQGISPIEGVKEIKHKLWPTMLTNWKVWPVLQLINFAFVPMNLQAAYVAFFSLFFNCYLSFMKFIVKRPD